MALPTRNLIIDLRQQYDHAVNLKFTPQITGSDGELLPPEGYRTTVNSDGTIDATGDNKFPLPCKSSGTIRWTLEITDKTSVAINRFFLAYEDGSDILLSELVAAGGAATETTRDYVNSTAVRFDTAQTLTDPQKAQARENIGVESGVTGTPGSVFFAGVVGWASEDNAGFFYEESTGRLKLGETSYVGTPAGWANSQSFLQIGFDNAVLNDTTPVYGGMLDMKRSQTSGTGQQTSGLRLRGWIVQTGGSGGTVTGTESFVRNEGSTIQTTLMQGVEGISNIYFDAFFSYGGYFQSAIQAGTGSAVNTLGGVRSLINARAGWTVAHAPLFETTATIAGVVTNLYGFRAEGWSGSGAVNSYVIKADDTTRRGSSENWFFHSTMLAPSLLSGGLVFAEQTAPSNPSANRVIIYAEDSGGKTRLMALFPTGNAVQLAIEA